MNKWHHRASGLTVKAGRELAGITQEAFGVRVNRTAQEVSNIERSCRGGSLPMLLESLRTGDLRVWGVFYRLHTGRRVPWELPEDPARPKRHRKGHAE
ncbi:MAG: hypothetical protein HY301_00010 [Verrucomicrobia bacterium]|nr:hypothetical protein [Verrucomicrobiota bacterium]